MKQEAESTTKIAGLKRKSNTDDADETVENSNGMKKAKTNKDTHIEAWEVSSLSIFSCFKVLIYRTLSYPLAPS